MGQWQMECNPEGIDRVYLPNVDENARQLGADLPEHEYVFSLVDIKCLRPSPQKLPIPARPVPVADKKFRDIC